MYHNLFVGLVVLLGVIANCRACTSGCVVDLPFGRIQGKCIDGYCSYTNVPYALPPTGKRRFESPVPFNQPWNGMRDGTSTAIGCIQFSDLHDKPNTSEDCLYLHIYVPGGESVDDYPVRAYVHGGGYMFGSSGDYEPEYIVKKDMIVASIGYRLGAFGFFSTGDTCIPGNYGLKDQREALRYIQKYIKYFKGDPNRVLLSGYSAGGASSHFHSLRTEKLFSAIMSNNGVGFNPWVSPTSPHVQYPKYAKYLGCPTTCNKLKACMKDKSVKALTSATTKLKEFGDNPFNVFGVVVENPKVPDAFLTENPEDIIRAGKTANVPLLFGYAEREGTYTAAEWMKLEPDGKPLINQINDSNWLKYAPAMLFYRNKMTASKQDEYSIYLKEKYMGDAPFSEESYRQFENIFTNVLYLNGIRKAICLHRKYAPGKLYVYEYKYPHNYTIGNTMAERSDIAFGADHGADGIFALPSTKLKQESLTSNQRKISDRLIELFKTLIDGKPTYDGVELPLNTPTRSGKLTINEYCHEIEYCNDLHCGDCSEFENVLKEEVDTRQNDVNYVNGVLLEPNAEKDLFEAFKQYMNNNI